MKADLAVVGLGCLLLAVGHTAVGRFVLPALSEERLPRTPFGPPSLTRSMVHFTWHVVSLQLVGWSVLFGILASEPETDAETLLLRWFAVLWLIATAMALLTARRRLASLARFPVPLLFLAVAVASWVAAG